jgi:hypothetical protein
VYLFVHYLFLLLFLLEVLGFVVVFTSSEFTTHRIKDKFPTCWTKCRDLQK